jgi:hypothetical protein
MCIAAWYIKGNKKIISHFCAVHALLPVQRAPSKNPKFVIWGRRKNECGQLPIGMSVTLESVKNNLWRAYDPQLVKIPVTKFMEHDLHKIAEWFDVPKGQQIQGLLLQHKNEKRLYIISVTKRMGHQIYIHWPQLVR